MENDSSFNDYNDENESATNMQASDIEDLISNDSVEPINNQYNNLSEDQIINKFEKIILCLVPAPDIASKSPCPYKRKISPR